MLKEEKSSLTAIGKDNKFNNVFEKLTTNIELTFDEKSYILASAILFFRYYQKNNTFLSFADISYYIVLKYAIKYKDYQPLFDFSVNFGFYPIAKSILYENLLKREKIIDKIINARIDDFINKDNYIETLEQNIKSKKFLTDASIEKCYLAPTSFGKSSLIIDYIRELPNAISKIVIVVPTKSLLMQTYHMIRDANLHKKVLIHDEMYNGEDSFIAIFTQERSLRLLNREGLFYDVLIIDEAHNLLKEDKNSNRNILLARLIARNKNLNGNQKVIYLSPLISDINKLRIDKNQNITTHNIKFNIKEPEFYEYLKRSVYKYNRFLNQFYKIESFKNEFLYILKNSKEKNFIYETSPKKIEELAKVLFSKFQPIEDRKDEIAKIIDNLRKEVHKDFYEIKYLERGIIYLHGQIPDLVKEYLENKFQNIPDIKYVIANTVILEGMNLPIDCLFIFNTWGLQGKELLNLIGRVNRLNSIFHLNSRTNLEMLLPQIHFINTDKNKNPHTNKIKELRSRIFADIIKNPLLLEFDFESLKVQKDMVESEKKRIQQIQENEKFLYSVPTSEFEKVKQSLIEADIYSYYFDFTDMIENFIKKRNRVIHKLIEDWKNKKVLDKIKFLFIDGLEIKDYEFGRLENQQARAYYHNYIYIARKKSFNERVNSQFDYFKERADSLNKDERLFYMGKYGDIPKYSEKHPDAKKPVFVDLFLKTDTEKVNLAIVKLKMEDDFISFKLNKFIVIMHDYNLISLDEYNLFVYGTVDNEKIALTKYGLNISLVSRLEQDNQLINLYFDDFNNLVAKPGFKKYLDRISDFQRFEIMRFIS
jgi:hypothetical protein